MSCRESNCLTVKESNFLFPNQTDVYHGKVRDVYFLADDRLIVVTTDRISAFDVILPRPIPYKGTVLNQIAAYFLDATADIVPNWKLGVPDPMVTVGVCCKPLKVEVIVRGYLAGSAWREYAAGAREICGVKLPEGLRENQKLPHPIITPTTKATTSTSRVRRLSVRESSTPRCGSRLSSTLCGSLSAARKWLPKGVLSWWTLSMSSASATAR